MTVLYAGGQYYPEVPADTFLRAARGEVRLIWNGLTVFHRLQPEERDAFEAAVRQGFMVSDDDLNGASSYFEHWMQAQGRIFIHVRPKRTFASITIRGRYRETPAAFWEEAMPLIYRYTRGSAIICDPTQVRAVFAYSNRVPKYLAEELAAKLVKIANRHGLGMGGIN